MTFKLRSLLPLVCLAATASVAHAAPFTYTTAISATVYNNASGNAGTPFGSQIGTFSVNQLEFSSSNNPDSTVGAQNFYTLGTFFNTLGSSATGASFNAGYNAGTSLANTQTVFTGSFTTTTAGLLNILHDDGIQLFLDSSATDYYGGSQSTPSFAGGQPSAAISAGNHTFKLYYAENGNAPAELETSFTPTAATPEPSSIMMLGTGLIGLAGVVRRKIKR